MIKKFIGTQIRKTGAYKAVQKENQSLKSQINVLKNENNNLKSTVTSFVNSREKIQTELGDLKAQNKIFQSQIESFKEKRHNIHELKKENGTLNNLNNNLNNEIQSLKRIFVEKNIHPTDDYSKLTIIIPYRRTDDEERENNLDISLKYLSNQGISNLIISEHSDVSAKEFLVKEYAHLFNSFKVKWNNSKGDLFSLAAAVNKGVMETETPYFAMMDNDCLIKKENIGMAISLLNKGFDVVHPFNRRVKDIIEKEKFIEEYDFETIKTPEQYRPWADGGIVFWNKTSFISMGMKNEHFTGWGGEDNETTIRSNMFQINHYRIDDTLYHLYHHRSLKRTRNNFEQTEKMKQMDKETCLTEINKWPWIIAAKNKFFKNTNEIS
jgi:cell division protein FtsB